MAQSVNSRQEGGEHYQPKFKDGVQHWDYTTAIGAEGLEYAASKYVARWKRKDGVIALKKALHYIEKRMESYQNNVGAVRGRNVQQALFNRFISDNDIAPIERKIIDLVLHWKRLDNLFEAHSSLSEYIRDIERSTNSAEEGGATSSYTNQD